MIKASDTYGDKELAKITVEKVLKEAGLTREEADILILRLGYEWFYKDIGIYIGNKYRSKPYSEGIIRYRMKKIQAKLDKYFESGQKYV